MNARIVTRRWVARRLHEIWSRGPYERCDALHYLKKAKAIWGKPRTIEGVVSGMVNYEHMYQSAVSDKKWISNAEKTLELLNAIEMVEELPSH